MNGDGVPSRWNGKGPAPWNLNGKLACRSQHHLPAPERRLRNGGANALQRRLPLDAARSRHPDDGRLGRGANIPPDVSVETAGPNSQLRGDGVVGRLPFAHDRKGIERIHGPGTLDEAPVLIARLVAEPRHGRSPVRASTNKPRRW